MAFDIVLTSSCDPSISLCLQLPSALHHCFALPQYHISTPECSEAKEWSPVGLICMKACLVLFSGSYQDRGIQISCRILQGMQAGLVLSFWAHFKWGSQISADSWRLRTAFDIFNMGKPLSVLCRTKDYNLVAKCLVTISLHLGTITHNVSVCLTLWLIGVCLPPLLWGNMERLDCIWIIILHPKIDNSKWALHVDVQWLLCAGTEAWMPSNCIRR